MTVKMKERSLFANGCLVQSSVDLYVAAPANKEETVVIPLGTVGIILERDSSRPSNTIYVQFLKGQTWWVRADEIEPHSP